MFIQMRTCSHGSWGPQADEVPHPGGVTDLSIQSFFYLDHVDILGVPGQPVRVTRLGGVSFLHVKAVGWGNPPNQGNQITQAW